MGKAKCITDWVTTVKPTIVNTIPTAAYYTVLINDTELKGTTTVCNNINFNYAISK